MKFEKKLGWEVLNKNEIESFSQDYIKFLESVKTEREVVKWIENVAKKEGFKDTESVNELREGDKVYFNFNNKTILLAKIGRKSPLEETRIIASHGDSPRLDLRIMPIEDHKNAGFGLFKISIYGGLVPYQWLNIPLEMRGIVVKGNKVIDVKERGLVIPDHLPHLSKKRFEERKAREVIKGEEMKVIAVNTKGKDKEEPFKSKILEILNEKYGIEEGDFVRAEIELVPELKPQEVGLDKSMIAGYGQDDRICVYTSVKALLDSNPEYTSIVWVVDREEIGSESNTAATSEILKYFVGEILKKQGIYDEQNLRKVFLNMEGISADVTAGIAPGFESVYDFDNSAKMGYGIAIEKYGSAAGRYYENEAHAEFVSWIIETLNKRKIPWQPALIISKAEKELGGGGTISRFLARLGMDVVDMGPAILGMHSPYEISSKADLYSTYLSYKAFFSEKKEIPL